MMRHGHTKGTKNGDSYMNTKGPKRRSIYFFNVLLSVIIHLFTVQNASGSLPFDTQPEEREFCTGHAEVGLCKNFVPKWYFTGTPGGSGNCSTFIWGGCGGNSANRFNSEAECMHHCFGEIYTLPAYLTTIATFATSPMPAPTFVPPVPSVPPVPPGERGKQLTFAETGNHQTFMFAQANTFIQLDGDVIQRFQLRLCREISFKFRTRLPHGLLVYHNVKNPPGVKLQPYALYVIVEKGQLKVVHVFGKHLTSVTVGRGLNRDEWHSVVVTIDVHGARLIAKVDQNKEEVYLKGLNHDTNYGVTENLTSVVLIGGLSSEEKLHGVKYIIESFVGCISDMTLSSGKAASDLLPIVPLIATKHENVLERCTDKCRTRDNLCFFGAQCVNHYSHYTCDCFGMKYEGELCDVYTATVLTLRGSSYVSYRVYDWKDRVHSANNKITLQFKTRFDDSALFYASGETIDLKHHYVAVSIDNASIYVEIDLGDGMISTRLGEFVNSNHWHKLTILHHTKDVTITLDQEEKKFEIPGNSYHMYIDPEIYIGGGPDLHKIKSLASDNNFAGNLRYVFYNDISIMYELKKGNPKVHYIGVLEPEFYDIDVELIPITYPFATSHFWWPINEGGSLNLTFDFKMSKNMAVLAYSDVITPSGLGFWEVRVVKGEIRFELVPDAGKNVTHLTSVKYNASESWHTVDLEYRNGGIKLSVDRRNKKAQMFGLEFQLDKKVIIGSGLKSANLGLIGCMRQIIVNGVVIEPRFVIQTERVVGEVALDNCRFVDPCTRPNTCEHQGRCSVRDDRITCDCSGTGYIGKNCHFAKFRKTCEELALLGYTKRDVYLIDIDGNGRFPPAHVKCEFQSLEDATKTIVEHNLPSQVDVRSASESDFSYKIKYREFSAEMLQELISHSLYCSQYIKYDCYLAPLDLHSATWFISSNSNDTVDYLGSVKRGSCPCGVNRTCADPSQSCNCDVNDSKWLSDEGYFTQPHNLGVTEMVFRQQEDLDENAQGRITLGPLECVETNTQQYVVTFTTSQSYIEVPGWRKGDIAFSFRTTGTSAILLFQPPIRPNYPSFMVALTSDYQLTFNFTLNTGTTRELVINSKRKLNGGEWHKIWIDYNFYHVRFMLNTEYQMVDLLLEEEFGPFEGSMFIGGAMADLLKKSTVKLGLIGCFRGLVVNGEILDIYSYMSVHLSEIIKDCKPSCVPNPCQNRATCKELWSTFQCVCKNPWAHLGPHCEININTKALTFTTPESYLKKNYLPGNSTSEEKIRLKKMMTDNLLMNLRTYDQNALIMYANDHLNNFIHLYITNGSMVVYMFNQGDEIVNLNVTYEQLNHGESVQIAILRGENATTLHVNDRNKTVDKIAVPLTEYTNKPWINPELEVLRPQRPPAPPGDYFQLNLGGHDAHSLHHSGAQASSSQSGYVGCIRGLKIGDYVVDLPRKAQNSEHDMPGLLPHCDMRCDSEPCTNGGVCTEDFGRHESSCDCELTSYYGEFCTEEKGADFSGESVLQRKFLLDGPVTSIKAKLAFSSSDLRQKNTVLLLLQTENRRSYYLLVAITPDGHLKFEEDREGSAYGAEIKDRSFLNGARHSVYYTRVGSSARLLIDRSPVSLVQLPSQSLWAGAAGDAGADEVHVGGLNTTDPRFAVYKGYSGCISNIFLEVNDYDMKPLEEYMLFTKDGAEKVYVTNSAGVRSAQCSAHFEEVHWPIEDVHGHIHNGTWGADKSWAEEPPARVPYTWSSPRTPAREQGTNVVFIVLITIFVLVIIGCAYEVWRSNRAHKRRQERETDEHIIRSKEQAGKQYESSTALRHSYKQLNHEEESPKKSLTNGIKAMPIAKLNGSSAVSDIPIVVIDAPPSDNESSITTPSPPPSPPPMPPPPHSQKRLSFRDSMIDRELSWEPLHESTELLASEQEIMDKDSDSESQEEEACEPQHRQLIIREPADEDLKPLPEEFPTLKFLEGGFAGIPKFDGENSGVSVEITKPVLEPVTPVNKRVPKIPKQVFVSPGSPRHYYNPINYLGGPRFDSSDANERPTSLQSVLSID